MCGAVLRLAPLLWEGETGKWRALYLGVDEQVCARAAVSWWVLTWCKWWWGRG